MTQERHADPNDWSREVGEPRYIRDPLARIVNVSQRLVRVRQANVSEVRRLFHVAISGGGSNFEVEF